MYTGFVRAASNRADLQFMVELIDPTTNDYVDLTGALITVTLRGIGAYGSPPLLMGTNNDGHITLSVDPGKFTVWFTRQEMTQFPPGEVAIGMTVRLASGITHQLVAGNIPIIDGVVAA
jgi:hypothetical protein